MDVTIPKVGQSIYLLNVGTNARFSEQKLSPATVKSVGRKYFRCNVGNSFVDIEFHLDSWLEHSNCSPGFKAYQTPQDWEDEKERHEAIKLLRDVFSYSTTNLTLKQLRDIKEILNRPTTTQTP